MKKTIFLFTMILVVILLVSCNQSNEINNSSETYEEQTTEMTETSKHTETTEVTETEEDSTTYGDVPDPFPMMSFNSFDQLIEFISICNSSEVEFNKYMEYHYPEGKYPWTNISERLFTYEHAREMYKNILSCPIILPKENVMTEYLGWAYYPESHRLITACQIDGIRYQYIYWYSGYTIDNSTVFEGEPKFVDIPFGDGTVDLYLDGDYYRGYTKINDLTVRVTVDALESTVAFEDFDLSFDIAEYLEANTPTE